MIKALIQTLNIANDNERKGVKCWNVKPECDTIPLQQRGRWKHTEVCYHWKFISYHIITKHLIYCELKSFGDLKSNNILWQYFSILKLNRWQNLFKWRIVTEIICLVGHRFLLAKFSESFLFFRGCESVECKYFLFSLEL